MNLMLRLMGAMLIAGALFGSAGCGGSGGGGVSASTPQARFFNATPDSTSLDILLDNTVKGSQLAYLGSNPDFVNVDIKDYDLSVEEHGSTEQLWDEAWTPQANQNYCIVALGLESFGSENIKRLRFAEIQTDRSIPNGNKSRLIVVHAFNRDPGFETPNIDFQTPGENPQFKLGNIAFGSSQTLLIDSGPQTLLARRAGTELVYAQKDVTLDSGKIYLTIVSGIESGVGPQAPQITLIPLTTR